jgi:predicted aminopeptidase
MTGCGLAAMAWRLALYRVYAPPYSDEILRAVCHQHFPSARDEYRRIIDRLAKGEKP